MYNKKWTAAIYLIPAIALVTVFIYVAIGLNFYYSLFRWSTYSEKVWVGFSNYVRMFQDENFWTALKNNLFFAVSSVTCQVGFALVLAAILEREGWWNMLLPRYHLHLYLRLYWNRNG